MNISESGFLILTGAKDGCSSPEEKSLMVWSYQIYMERATFSAKAILRTASKTVQGRRSGTCGILFPPHSADQILHQEEGGGVGSRGMGGGGIKGMKGEKERERDVCSSQFICGSEGYERGEREREIDVCSS